MKTKVLCIAFIALFTSCASTVKFPVSDITPAAEITVSKKQDKNKNYVIELTAKNLASADRLNPSKKNYSVWIVTVDGVTKNSGQLIIKNAEKASLKTVSPYNIKEIFITAENQGNLTYPSGVEISRAIFDK